jgi:hypothetical protein
LKRNLNAEKPERKPVIKDILLFLAWSDLRTGTLAGGERWLTELDRLFPASTERLALRWDLMQRLLQRHSYRDYQNQAGLFLSDAKSADFGGAVLETMGVVYTDLTWKQRLGLSDSVHPSLIADPRVRASVSQWQCPALFGSHREAHSWMQRISPEHLDFAPRMKADALIALGRGAEWDRDWAGMETRARAALQIIANYLEAVFLLTRSLLRQAGRTLPEELTTVALPDEPKWHRLRLQCSLREDGGLERTGALIAMLPQVADAGDLLELDLSIRLLETPLTARAVRRPDHIAQCAELSSQLQNVAETFLSRLPFFKCYCARCAEAIEFPREMEGPTAVCPHCRKNIVPQVPQTAVAWLPWTEVNLAFKEIHVDRSYGKAFQRLEIPALESYSPARSIAQIARLMAGSPKPPAEKNAAPASVPVLAHALRAVAGQVEMAGHWSELRTEVSAALADPSLREFPALAAAGEILALAVRLLGEDPGARADILRCTVAEDSPLWSVWLFSRLVEALSRDSDSEANLSRIPLAGPAVAWFVEVWCYNYAKVGGELPAVALNAQELLNRSLPPSPLRTARLQNYRQPVLPADYAPPANAFAELGEICSAHSRSEIALELDIARFRVLLAGGEPAAAAGRLRKLSATPGSISPLADLWWGPLITFWLGVAEAHQHDPEAAATFRALLDGPCAGVARGHLALLALQDGSLDEAARWLDGAPGHVPCVRYADALLLARRGKLSEARQRLESSEAIRIFTGSSYAVPAQRLIAALEERSGNQTESERLHTAILASHPGDQIASARRGRVLIEAAFSPFRADGTPLNPETALPREVPETAGAAKIAWWRPYAILQDLMSVPDDALPQLEHAVREQFGTGARSFAWRQLLAHRFLRANDAARALQTFDIPPAAAGSPRWFEQARLVLTAWHWLTRVSQEGARTAAWQKLQECSHALIPLAQGRSDSLAALWGAMVERALQVESTASLDALIRDSQTLGNPPFCYVPRLWSETADQRRLAGEVLLSALGQGGTGWNEEQTLLLRALAAWAVEKDETYVEQYTILEPVLDELPVRGRDLWVPAALIRFSKCDWQGLAGSCLPDCIADMSDPLVCLIVELVDARAAAGDLKKPSQAVAQRVKGIYNNLAALMERLNSDSSGNGSKGQVS